MNTALGPVPSLFVLGHHVATYDEGQCSGTTTADLTLSWATAHNLGVADNANKGRLIWSLARWPGISPERRRRLVWHAQRFAIISV